MDCEGVCKGKAFMQLFSQPFLEIWLGGSSLKRDQFCKHSLAITSVVVLKRQCRIKDTKNMKRRSADVNWAVHQFHMRTGCRRQCSRALITCNTHTPSQHQDNIDHGLQEHMMHVHVTVPRNHNIWGDSLVALLRRSCKAQQWSKKLCNCRRGWLYVKSSWNRAKHRPATSNTLIRIRDIPQPATH